MMLADIRDASGKLPAFAWPGGYPLVYITRDSLAVCPACANRDGDDLAGVDVNWEQDDLTCDDCSSKIPSAYGADND